MDVLAVQCTLVNGKFVPILIHVINRYIELSIVNTIWSWVQRNVSQWIDLEQRRFIRKTNECRMHEWKRWVSTKLTHIWSAIGIQNSSTAIRSTDLWWLFHFDTNNFIQNESENSKCYATHQHRYRCSIFFLLYFWLVFLLCPLWDCVSFNLSATRLYQFLLILLLLLLLFALKPHKLIQCK